MPEDRLDQPAGSLPPVQVLKEEFECLHGPVPPGTNDLGAVYTAIHRLPEPRSALCLSGGDIRSAAFALGILQGLARIRVLSKFDYLSTVSTGGYIGGWLTAWLHRCGNDVARVSDSIAGVDSGQDLAVEPSPVGYLRTYCGYLTPGMSVLSLGTWTIAATLFRNMMLIWLVLIPVLAAVLMIPRFYLSLLAWAYSSNSSTSSIPLVVGAVLLSWTAAYIAANIPSGTTARRGQGKFLKFCLLPFILGLACLTIYWAAESGHTERGDLSSGLADFVRFGVVVQLLAWVGYTLWLRTPWGLGRPPSYTPAGSVITFVSNLLVVVMAGAIGGAVLWLLATKIFARVGNSLVVFAALAPPLLLFTLLLATTVFIGMVGRWTDDDDQEWWQRCNAWFLLSGVVWALVSAVVLFGPELTTTPLSKSWLTSIGGAAGVITFVWGRIALPAFSSSAFMAQVARVGLLAIAGIFTIVLLLTISVLTTHVLGPMATMSVVTAPPQWPFIGRGPSNHTIVLLASSPWTLIIVATILAAIGSVMAWLVNTNRFSLDAIYRARLIRVFLGASNVDRRADPFSGFDDTDNIQMHELWPRSSSAGPGVTAFKLRKALFHVINISLSLVHGDRLGWQQHKAHSFTVSPLHAGSTVLGAFRRTRSTPESVRGHYGGINGMSLGTAVTISGAAASRSLGYRSSQLITFASTLLSPHLAWWYGNPGTAGDHTFYLASPRYPIRSILANALGLMKASSPYVYLSDGGQVDNLGLYEMVFRRCKFIVVCDATTDEDCEFNDLGKAIRRIRVDLGVPIEFPDGMSIYSRSADAAVRARGFHWALGRVRYSVVDRAALRAESLRGSDIDGWLLYLKPAFYGDEPPDVYEYAMANKRFPHEASVGPFTESQFESYRMLGAYTVSRVSSGWEGCSLAEFMSHIAERSTI